MTAKNGSLSERQATILLYIYYTIRNKIMFCQHFNSQMIKLSPT